MKLNITIIEAKRKRLGITKSELARRSGISKQLLNFYLNNPDRLNNVSQIARALKCTGKSIIAED
jgi:transcriptional regulator with XRE-family HTH domain